MNTSEAAIKLGTDARTLRRFLRADPTYNNPGSAGRYTFADRDIPTMKKRFAAWMAQQDKNVATRKESRTTPVAVTPHTATPAEERIAADLAGLTQDPVDAHPAPIPRRLTGARAKAENDRVARLEAALRQSGVHISQHPER